MERLNQAKYPSFWCLLAALLASSCIAFYLATLPPSPADAQTAVGNANMSIDATAQQEKLIIGKGKTGIMGKYALTYQGLDAGSVVIDVTLLDPDSAYVYRRKITKESAQTGFWLSHHRYLMVSASRNELRLMRLNG